jgi:hypothetical protein
LGDCELSDQDIITHSFLEGLNLFDECFGVNTNDTVDIGFCSSLDNWVKMSIPLDSAIGLIGEQIIRPILIISSPGIHNDGLVHGEAHLCPEELDGSGVVLLKELLLMLVRLSRIRLVLVEDLNTVAGVISFHASFGLNFKCF